MGGNRGGRGGSSSQNDFSILNMDRKWAKYGRGIWYGCKEFSEINSMDCFMSGINPMFG